MDHGTIMDGWIVPVVGDTAVGKTAITLQFAWNYFVDESYRRQLMVDNRRCFIEPMDGEGMDLDEFLRDLWPRKAKGVILLYSIVSRSTFNRLEEIRKLVITKDEGAIFILVGNKCDSATGREVSIEEGAAMARQFGCQFVEASAKTAQNVELVFATLIRALRQTRGDTIGTSSTHAEPTQLRKRKNRCIIL
ncbi:ras protein [Mycena metata]|uniref:Ras protein n=1 Tax=Mycena metata TaxID=1033252 RepID=A0AAD7P385_9AGAR|nr:ras protein [Mycena metata]